MFDTVKEIVAHCAERAKKSDNRYCNVISRDHGTSSSCHCPGFVLSFADVMLKETVVRLTQSEKPGEEFFPLLSNDKPVLPPLIPYSTP